MSNIVHSNKNNNRSVRGLQRAVDNIFDSFFTGWDGFVASLLMKG